MSPFKLLALFKGDLNKFSITKWPAVHKLKDNMIDELSVVLYVSHYNFKKKARKLASHAGILGFFERRIKRSIYCIKLPKRKSMLC